MIVQRCRAVATCERDLAHFAAGILRARWRVRCGEACSPPEPAAARFLSIAVARSRTCRQEPVFQTKAWGRLRGPRIRPSTRPELIFGSVEVRRLRPERRIGSVEVRRLRPERRIGSVEVRRLRPERRIGSVEVRRLRPERRIGSVEVRRLRRDHVPGSREVGRLSMSHLRCRRSQRRSPPRCAQQVGSYATMAFVRDSSTQRDSEAPTGPPFRRVDGV